MCAQLIQCALRPSLVAFEVRGLGDHPATPDQAQDRPLERRAAAQRPRRPREHLGRRGLLAELRDRALDPRQRLKARVEPLAQALQRHGVVLAQWAGVAAGGLEPGGDLLDQIAQRIWVSYGADRSRRAELLARGGDRLAQAPLQLLVKQRRHASPLLARA